MTIVNLDNEQSETVTHRRVVPCPDGWPGCEVLHYADESPVTAARPVPSLPLPSNTTLRPLSAYSDEALVEEMRRRLGLPVSPEARARRIAELKERDIADEIAAVERRT